MEAAPACLPAGRVGTRATAALSHYGLYVYRSGDVEPEELRMSLHPWLGMWAALRGLLMAEMVCQ